MRDRVPTMDEISAVPFGLLIQGVPPGLLRSLLWWCGVGRGFLINLCGLFRVNYFVLGWVWLPPKILSRHPPIILHENYGHL